jgi:hypothetical protein
VIAAASQANMSPQALYSETLKSVYCIQTILSPVTFEFCIDITALFKFLLASLGSNLELTEPDFSSQGKKILGKIISLYGFYSMTVIMAVGLQPSDV